MEYICFDAHNVLLLDITFLFIFLRDADSRKGALCPFCVPIHKEEEEEEKKNINL